MCPPVPITAANLGRYAAYLADFKQLSPCSILKYMNIIRLLHLEAGFSNPLIDCWILDSVIRGIKRCNGKEPDRKLPITPHILARMHYLINKDSPFDVVFWPICLVLFYGMLRKSNVLCPSLAFNPSKHLCLSDFFVHPWGLEIKIRWSKTIQFRDRCLSVPLPFLPGNKLCPATAVINAFKLCPSAPPCGPAFVYPAFQVSVAIKYASFMKHLRCLLDRLGLPTGRFATHSFRRGGATFALQRGIPSDVIMQLGDWHSDAYKVYLNVPLQFKAARVKTMGASIWSSAPVWELHVSRLQT